MRVGVRRSVWFCLSLMPGRWRRSRPHNHPNQTDSDAGEPILPGRGADNRGYARVSRPIPMACFTHLKTARRIPLTTSSASPTSRAKVFSNQPGLGSLLTPCCADVAPNAFVRGYTASRVARDASNWATGSAPAQARTSHPKFRPNGSWNDETGLRVRGVTVGSVTFCKSM
jgi:hypothetical protein